MSQVYSDQTPPPNPQVSSVEVALTAVAPAPDGTQQVPQPSNQPAASGVVTKAPDALGEDFDFSGLDMSEEDADALLSQLATQTPAPAAAPTPPAPPVTPAPAGVQTPVEPATPAPPAEVPGKMRVPTGGDPVAAQALNIYTLRVQQGTPITLAEADALARNIMGLPTTTAAQPAPAPTESSAPAPAAPTSIDDRVAAVTQQMTAAMDMMSDGYDPAKVAQLQAQLMDLATDRAFAKLQESQTADSDAAYRLAWNENYTRATEQWPELADPASSINLLAGALQQAAQSDPQHPDHQRSLTGEAGYYFAERAAKELGKATSTPTTSAASTASSPNAPVPTNTPPLAGIFGGGGSPPSAPNPGADTFNQLMSMGAEDWQALEYQATTRV